MDLDKLLELATSSESAPGQDRITELHTAIQQAASEQGDALDLHQLESTVIETFRERYAEGEYDPADAPTLEALADITDAIRAEKTQQEQARAELDERVSGLAARVDGDPGDDEDGGDESGDDDSGEGTHDTDDSGASGEADDDSMSQDAPVGTVPEPVPASGTVPTGRPRSRSTQASGPGRRRVSAASLNAHRPRQTANGQQPRMAPSIHAAADVPDTPTGKQLSLRELAESTMARFRSMPVGQPDTGEVRKSLATIQRNYRPDLVASGQFGNDTDAELVERVADERQLPGGSLVAAARIARKQAEQQTSSGTVTAAIDPLPTPPNDIWCAPSTNDYSLCPPLGSRAGLLDLPSIAMPSMGGIRYPVWYQYPDMHRAPESNQPDADPPGRNSWHGYSHLYSEISGDGPDNPARNKKCISGPCPDWAEERMNLQYLCVEGDILRSYVWPQLMERFISDTMLSHAHYMNEVYLAHIINNSDTLPAFSAGDAATAPDVNGFGIGSAAEAVIERVGYLVTWFRTTYRMEFAATLEGFAPWWFREFLKVDLERKQNRPSGTVSNSEVDELFAQWNTRIQWVYDHPQDLDTTNQWTGDVSGGVMPGPGANWPNSATLTLYPAGSWVLAEDNIIRLDALYDSTKLRQNRYTALFTEDAWLLMNRCNRSFNVPLIDLCANGAVGPNRDACAPGTTVVSVAVTPDSATTTVGGTTDLTATATMVDGSEKDVTARAVWSSDNTAAATVSGGTVTGVASDQGTANVTATFEGVTSNPSVITVNPAAAAASKSKQQ